ncbi:type II toxin-antitoxin system RelB/DinJ family antitoxin [Candidatus Halobeggiatoa sp. HSG11]|nr:type II toxin-antitoxin system RelB/DinJ family antitoxin [Candidatus Halobeggiatoa sp. HSG11]
MKTNINVNEISFKEAQKIFDSCGMSFNEAINLFLTKVSIEKTIPFELNIPSDELLKRIKDVEYKRNLVKYESSNELFDDLGI